MNGKRIYIVEDDPALRGELLSLLSLQGYSVTCCEDFPNAASEAVSLGVDLAIVDLRLPQADGLAITRDIREKRRARAGAHFVRSGIRRGHEHAFGR